jgi:CRP-like cAMP-binding protein
MSGLLKNRLTDERLQKYAPYFKRMEVPAKTILLKEGEISKRAYWIESGCIRVWFNNDGKDVTYQFFFENSTVASIESLRKNIPSVGYMRLSNLVYYGMLIRTILSLSLMRCVKIRI